MIGKKGYALATVVAGLLLFGSVPPAAADAPMVGKMAKIGIVPGQDFDISKLDPAVAKGLGRAPKAGGEKIMGNFKTFGTFVNGWAIFTKTGLYGTDYLDRALVTAIGLGANRPTPTVIRYRRRETAVPKQPLAAAVPATD